MPWIQLKLNTTGAHAEELSDALMEAGSVSITFQDTHDTPVFEPLPVTPLARSRDWRTRGADTASWDLQPTIFPFLLRRREGPSWRPLRPEEMAWLYRQMREPQAGERVPLLAQLRFQIGQPVVCGVRDGQALTALRLCVGARDISAATAGARGTAEALTQARLALDKLAWLISRL